MTQAHNHRRKALMENMREGSAYREPEAIDCKPRQVALAEFAPELTGERVVTGYIASSVACSALSSVTGHE
jgi:hypothetical protein